MLAMILLVPLYTLENNQYLSAIVRGNVPPFLVEVLLFEPFRGVAA